MTARTIAAFVAAAFFGYLALFYIAPGAFMGSVPVDVGEAYTEELEGTDIGLAVTSAVRTLSVGLTILSLAAVEWGALVTASRGSDVRRPEAGTDPTGA